MLVVSVSLKPELQITVIGIIDQYFGVITICSELVNRKESFLNHFDNYCSGFFKDLLLIWFYMILSIF